MADILNVLRTNLTAARAKQEDSANFSRSLALAYRVGDKVFLNTRNIITNRLIKKFDYKFISPFKIIRIINSHSYQLELPFEHELLHNNFHTSLLRPVLTNGLPGQINPPPLPISLDESGEKLWAIKAILDSKRTKAGFQYLILWRGYNPDDQTWEPLCHVVNAKASILEFERRFPRKIKPTKQEIDRAKTAAKTAAAETRPNISTPASLV